MKNTSAIKGNLIPTSLDVNRHQVTKQFNNLSSKSKQNEILNRFHTKLEEIDQDIHKLISKLYIPEIKNNIN